MKTVHAQIIIAVTALALFAIAIAANLSGHQVNGTSTTTIISTGMGTLNASQQQASAMQYGLSLPYGYFACVANSDCEKVLVSPCDNNLPSQFACINGRYYAAYSAEYNSSVVGQGTVCAQYIIDENITCSCSQSTNTCDENYGPH